MYMAKKTTKGKDPNQLAKSIVDQATGQASPKEPPVDEDTMRAVMREMGRRGGLKGGKARAEKLSARKRKEIARKAAEARWNRND